MPKKPQTVIVLSSPTCATGSIWRACQALVRGRYETIAAGHKFYQERRLPELRHWIPPEHGCIILFNAPHLFNTSIDLSKYRFVLNARDPRDLLCNQFHWKLVHPSPADAPGDLERRAGEALQLGIDAFAVKANCNGIYKALQNITQRAPRENWMFLGYAMWCLEFDDVVSKLAGFLGVDLQTLPSEARNVVAMERAEELSANARWVGQKWKGSDIAPGRHRSELKAETIAELTERYVDHLRWLREVDDPRMAELYC